MGLAGIIADDLDLVDTGMSAQRRAFLRRQHVSAVRILVIDDSAGFVRAVAGFLATFSGVQLIGHALSGSHGVRMAREMEPDLVLLDWMMPGMNGPDTARELKTLPAPPKIVLLSLMNGPECIADAHAAGADAFLFKGELTAGLPQLMDGMFDGAYNR